MYQMDDVFFILKLENKKIEIYQRFRLILCNFWRPNCLKTWIFAFWTTLVNSCWPHVCDMAKYILGLVSIYLKSLPPTYHAQKCKTHHGGSKKPYFFPTTGWWNNHLHIANLCSSKPEAKGDIFATIFIIKIDTTKILVWSF